METEIKLGYYKLKLDSSVVVRVYDVTSAVYYTVVSTALFKKDCDDNPKVFQEVFEPMTKQEVIKWKLRG